MTLDDHDLRAVLGAATALAADATPPFESVLDLLRSLIECDMASFNDMTLATADYRALARPPEIDAMTHGLKPAFDRYAHQHPLINAAGASMGALRFCDVADGDVLTETELFTHFFEPMGVRYQLIIQLASPPDVVVGYALSRGPAGCEFSDRDVAVLDALGPHLAMHHRTVVNRERSGALRAEAARSGWTVAAVRSDGIVDGFSPVADGSPLVAGARVPPEVADLLPVGAAAEADATSHTLSIDGQQWRCVVRPMPAGPTMVLMRFAGDDVGGSAGLVDMGLTPRQIEVAMELAATGATNAQLARRLAISEGTVKKHLETVFAVLGVESRAAAIVALADSLS